MADEADLAQGVEERAREEALARARKPAVVSTSALNCVDCGDEIPEARRKAILTDRCVECAEAAETAR